ncbi:GEVED domain-containing protein [Rhodopirellula halodulae]|uniref:GEVED domain-containing protein n=1 Tax=Rhodopirellula halodulae TaxID=2894198 RepID=UPI001E51361A|nr:GEVED domain-containing protein [Rhodopirellula sp. JC737]MCC9656420.1 pre-peptidase C-terminal domain-containing protein [Rhodopirellula sp. JC737]
MTIGNPGNSSNMHNVNDSAGKRRDDRRRRSGSSLLGGQSRRGKTQRAKLERRLQSQALESRQLLAGPELVAIQPNASELIDNSSTIRNVNGVELLNVSPNELTFRFDDDSSIDPTTLGTAANPLAISVTRAGADGGFEAATAVTDFNTSGNVLVEFQASAAGVGGNGTTVSLTGTVRSLTTAPVIITQDPENNQLNIDLNANPSRQATVRDLTLALQNYNATQRNLGRDTVADAFQVSGPSSTPIGQAVAGQAITLTLSGANAAQTSTDLGLGNAFSTKIVAKQSGVGGQGISIIVQPRDFGGPTPPLVSVSGKTITVQINRNASSPTTVGEFIDAINNTPTAADLVTATQERGSLSQSIGNFGASLALTGATDTPVNAGFIGIGSNPNEVVFRFAEPLPDDAYQIEIFGSGDRALRNLAGEAFNDGVDFAVPFILNKPPQVLAVVPEPIDVDNQGQRTPRLNMVDVYFTEDVNVANLSAQLDLFQLIYTRDTVTGEDDTVFTPNDIDAIPGKPNAVRLTFDDFLNDGNSNFSFSEVPDLTQQTNPPTPIDQLPKIPGAIRLKIGNDSALPMTPGNVSVAGDAGDSFDTATIINNLNGIGAGQTASVRLTGGEIDNPNPNDPLYTLDFPGGTDYQGVRNIRPDDPSRLERTVPLDVWRRGADTVDGITTAYYNFPTSWLGDEPSSSGLDLDKTYINQITEEQKQRVREVMSLFSEYLGVQFIEVGDTASGAVTSIPSGAPLLSITLGELYGSVDDNLTVNSAVGGVTLDTRPLDINGLTFLGTDPNADSIGDRQLLVMDSQDFDSSVDDQTGGEFFRGAFLGIGQLLGYGYADHLPQPVTQSTGSVLEGLNPESPDVVDLASQLGDDNEALFPSPSDIVNGQYLFRPEANDIDLYRFELSEPGKLSISTVAQRLSLSSTLDTALRLYKQVGTDEYIEIAQNDDYFSDDSLIEIDILEAGDYVIGVSASGNTSYNPVIAGTGIGGVTEGTYELVVSYETAAASSIMDNPVNGTAAQPLDGDADGKPGGEFNFWFNPTDPDAVVYVDSLTGTNLPDRNFTAADVTNFDLFVTMGTPTKPVAEIDDAIRLAEFRSANGGTPVTKIRVIGGGTYEIGRSSFGSELKDGSTLNVPKDIALVIDGGSTFRMSRSRIGVGSTSESVDRSNSSLQILGTPDQMVSFVGLNGQTGSWGGIDLRGDIDFADDSKTNMEDNAVFLNHIQYADIQHGGGQVSVDGQTLTISPIELADVRATILNNQIRNSAQAAIAATPNTFEETRFDESQYQNQVAPGAAAPSYFTSDVTRIGPHIRGNTLTNNSINGLQIRLSTPTGGDLQSLDVNARFDDTDIVHVLTENLLIEGNPGGVNAANAAPSVLLVRSNSTTAPAGETGLDAGAYVYRMTFIDENGFESTPSDATSSVTVGAGAAVQLSGLPTVTANSGFSGRRLYRATVDANGNPGEFRLVARLNTSDTSYRDATNEGSNLLNPSIIAGTLLAGASGSIQTSSIPNPAGGGTGLVEPGRYVYRFTFATADGTEVGPSSETQIIETIDEGSILVSGIPAAPAGSGFASRIVYRAEVASNGTVGEYRQVAVLNASQSSFTDGASIGTDRLDLLTVTAPLQARAGRLDPSLVIDPGMIVKLDGARIDVTFDAHLYAEGTAKEPIILTSLNDDRYGTGGAFNTNNISQGTNDGQNELQPGDWSGVYLAFGADASFDHAVLAGGGGSSRIEGGFASFNVLEVHQSDLRVANSRFEDNADGRGFLNDSGNNTNNPNDPREERVGRVNNASGTVFVRGAQPVMVDNEFVDGSGPAMSFDVNSFSWQEVTDPGRSTASRDFGLTGNVADSLDRYEISGNSGPLIAGNAIDSATVSDEDVAAGVVTAGLNGLEVRGGTVATEVVWDDTDIVHIVRGMIEIPNQHIYGGLRLESDARGSLVVKFQNQDLDVEDVLLRRQAGIVAGGTLLTAEDEMLDIANRIGGSLQVVGQPDFPVVLTSLLDDTVGAGFTPDGQANIDTDNNGVRVDEDGNPIAVLTSDSGNSEATPPLLPLGQEYDRTNRAEVDNGTTIDNDIDPNAPGYLNTTVLGGGELQNVVVTGIDQNAGGALLAQQNYAFLYTTYIEVTSDTGGRQRIPLINAFGPNDNPNPILVGPDRVRSSGVFTVFGREIRFTAESFIVDNRAVAYTKLDFETVDGADFSAGNINTIRVFSYLDQGVTADDNDVLYQIGTPGQSDFRLMTLNQTARVGFSHGGVYENDSVNQFNASYTGWLTDDAGDLLNRLNNVQNGFNFDIAANINGDIPGAFGPVAGAANFDGVSDGTVAISQNGQPADIETALIWQLDGGSDAARVTSFVEWIPFDPANPASITLPQSIDGAGSWDGITIREAASDSNVSIASENEPGNVGNSDTNATPATSQYLGELAPSIEAGDESRRIGLIVEGEISSRGDEDVFAFVAEAGTQVWLDIDRTNSNLDTIVELIDANGNTLILSDDSLAEARQIEELLSIDPTDPNAAARRAALTAEIARRSGGGLNGFDLDQVLGLGTTLVDATAADSMFQDNYSTNARDAGMRIVLPGTVGQRLLYHIRVRSGLTDTAEATTLPNGGGFLTSADSLGKGRTTGSYQLQIRLGEDDVFAGTQVRYSDVRFATNGVQVIGGPMHSPLAGDDFETDSANNTLSNAQRLGLYDNQFTSDGTITTLADGSIVLNRDSGGIDRVDIDLENPAGPLSSDSLSKNISGFLTDGGDVDWYEFDVDYRQLTRDDAALYLATIFDVDYSDGLARADTALYVFNSLGELVLIGGDSNVADDQTSAGAGYDPSDLSRGSFGTADPYIGSAELPEGTYYVAISNQSRQPAVLDQFTNRDTANPLLRLEPVDSIRRIAEENFSGSSFFYPGTASAPVQPVLFDQNSILDYSLDDVVLYVNTQSSLFVVNPFTGETYGVIGNFGDEVRDIAFTANGELFAYTGYDDRPAGDTTWTYNRIDTATAQLSAPLSVGAGIETFHNLDAEAPPAQQILDEASDDGIEVEAITIRSRFGAETGFFVGNRPTFQAGLEYINNILYAFNEETGEATGPVFDLALAAAGAGTDRREIGAIDTAVPAGNQDTQLGIADATANDATGLPVARLFDGDTFSLTNGTETVTFELNQGFTILAASPADSLTGASLPNAAIPIAAGTTLDPASIVNDTLLTIEVPGSSPVTFQITDSTAAINPNNVRVPLDRSSDAVVFIDTLESIIRQQGIPVSAKGTQLALPTATNVQLTGPGATAADGIALVGDNNVAAGNTSVTLLPTDTAETIAFRISQAVQAANTGGSLPTVTATAQGNSLAITGAIANVSSVTGAIRAGGSANGGLITGVELVGNNLYGVSSNGGLYIVPSAQLNGTGNRFVGNYVSTATDLIGLNFTGLRAGPNSVEDGAYSDILFGTTSNGRIYAFNTRGELQPIFAGGRTFIETGIFGALGLDFSTLDYNLWHVAGARADDPGHGYNQNDSDTRFGFTGGNSLQFNYTAGAFNGNYNFGEAPVQNFNTANENVRQDGQDVQSTYNFPGGAKGIVQSNTFSLEGYSSADLPTMYFNYFLETDGVDDDTATDNDDDLFSEDRDTLRVYVIDDNGVEHLVATNNESRGNLNFDDEFDDPAQVGIYDDDIDVDVQQLFDNTGNWRQARVPLNEFAGQSNLALRIEFSTAGTTATNTAEIRTVAASGLADGETFTIGGQLFSIDLSPTIAFPSGAQLAQLFGTGATAEATFVVDGQEYILTDGTRAVAADQIAIDVTNGDPSLLSSLTAADVASSVASVFDTSVSVDRLVPSGAELALFYQNNPDEFKTIFINGNEYLLDDGFRDTTDAEPQFANTNLIPLDLLAIYETFDDADPNVETIVDLSQEDVARVLSAVIGETDGSVDYDQLVPTGTQLATLYQDPTERFVVEIDGVEYVLNDGTRSIAAGQVSVLIADLSQSDIGGELQAVVEQNTGVQSPQFATVDNFDFSDASDPVDPFGNPNPVGATGRNDLIFQATPLPYVDGNLQVTGRGTLGTVTGGGVTNLGDVDLSSVEVAAGTTITVDATSDNPGVLLNVRFFDSNGVELRSPTGGLLAVENNANGTVSLTAPSDGVIYIGISGPENGDYDPRVSGTTSAAQVGGYDLTISINPQLDVQANASVVEFNGAGTVSVATGSGLRVGSQNALPGIPIRISQSATAVEVAAALRQALANRFTDGDTTLIPQVGSAVRLPNLTINDSGPFASTAQRYGDRFGANGAGAAADNASNGAFIDDIIIGFAERGEMVTAANPIGVNEEFVLDQSVNLTNPPQPTQPTVSGAYQLEIRDASEYVSSGEVPVTTPQVQRNQNGTTVLVAVAADGTRVTANANGQFLDINGNDLDLTGFTGPFGVSIDDGSLVALDVANEPIQLRGVGEARFRTFDTNERLSSGITLTTLPAAEIEDGATFTLADANTRLTFEFDISNDLGSFDGIVPEDNRVAVRLPRTASAAEVANEIIRLINSTQVQAVIDGSASRANGTVPPASASSPNALVNADTRINLYGDLSVRPDTAGRPAFANIEIADLRGDTNRVDEAQGVIMIENNRFLFSSNAGVDINRDATARVTSDDLRDATPSILTYARNLIELNTENLIPGVVVQNNVIAFNADAGIRITGLDGDGSATQDPVGFDRIVNNTLVGGPIESGAELGPQVFESILFDQGGISFADAVVQDTLSLGPDVSSEFTDPEAALGSPDCHGVGPEPTSGQFTFSLGSGGQATFLFQDNLLTGDGTSAPDLVIFESGEPERIAVEISRDGVTFFSVGQVFGADNTIDLDSFGFGPNDQFGFVRLTDLSPAGTFEFGAAGADIDGIGAISTIAREIYTPGSQGIVVQQNSAPTILNNIVANFQTGIAVSAPQNNVAGDVDVSRDLTVIGGNTFFRNANNSTAGGTGLFAQFISPFQQIFVDPVNLVFTPQAGTATIDSGINSLEDRASLQTVRGAIGLPPSPIVAPVYDLNGQLRVDDPNVATPNGLGFNVFVDRGAEERGDSDGPRFVVTSPRGDDLFDLAGQAFSVGTIHDAFEIQLVDGIAPADAAPGVGIDDSTVRSELVRVTRFFADSDEVELLSEGVDYRFSYEPGDNKIRLTPIGGVWPDNATYTVELLGSTQSGNGTGVLNAQPGRLYADGATTQIGDKIFEADTGIGLSILPSELTRVNPLTNLIESNIDGQLVTIFDGVNEYTFEFDTEAIANVAEGNIPVRLPAAATAEQISDIFARAINESGVQLVAVHMQIEDGATIETGRLQLLGATAASENAYVSFESDSFLRHTNQVLDVTLLITTTDGINDFDGQQISIFDGQQELTFEFDSNGAVTGNADVVVAIRDDSTPRQIVAELLAAITTAGLNVEASGASGNFRISGTNGPISVTSLTGGVQVEGNSEIGTSFGFGIIVPTEEGVVSPLITDGQTFTISRGTAQSVTFELDFDGFVNTPGAIAVNIPGGGFGGSTADQVADALVTAISANVVGLTPVNLGGGRISLGGDDQFSLNLAGTALSQSGFAGQPASIPVIVPLDDVRRSSLEDLVEDLQATNPTKLAAIQPIVDILSLSETGVRRIAHLYGEAISDAFAAEIAAGTLVVQQPDTRILIEGASIVRGQSVVSERITDEVGNPLLAGEAIIFVGDLLDFGDAADPRTPVTVEDNGPRHVITEGFQLGSQITADADGVDNGSTTTDTNADGDDGVAILGAMRPGFSTQFVIDIQSPTVGGVTPAFYLDAWFDWNGDGVFQDGEVERFGSIGSGASRVIGTGGSTVNINVPSDATTGSIQTRFRLSNEANLGATGLAQSGEVEDYTFVINNNPFQNPSLIYDVNASGATTPLDALLIINALNAANGDIDLDNIPAGITLPQYPDVNGNGVVSALDALNVINRLNEIAGPGDDPTGASGEPLVASSTSYSQVSDGVLASGATIAFDPTVTETSSGSVAAGEPIVETESKVVGDSTSVFDSAAVISLDDVVETLANDQDQADPSEESEISALDSFFASMN